MLKIKRLRPSAQIPSYATPGSAGLDLCADLDAPVTLEPGGDATDAHAVGARLWPEQPQSGGYPGLTCAPTWMRL